MALVYADRVKETTTTTGTGTYTLAGAATGYQSFSDALSNSDTCYYTVTDGTDWEVGLGTFTTSGTLLARTTITASSNSNAAVSWSAGSKDVFITIPAKEVKQPMIILNKTSNVNQNVGGANGTEVYWTWDGEMFKDDNYTHSTVTNSERVTVALAGWYEVVFIGGAQTTGSARTTLQGIYKINGGSSLRGGSLRNYARGSSYGNMTTGIIYTLELGAGDYIEVGTRVEDSDGAYTINTSGGEIADDCHQFVIKKVR